MAHARRHGVPTPLVIEASGPDLVMERVTGPTMLSDLVARPERAAQHGRLLAELHASLDCVPAIESRGNERLLHLDLHPANVLLSDAGPVLVDWTNAASGERSLDVATTWVVLRCLGETDEVAPALDVLRGALLTAFLEHVDRSAAADAVPEAAAARLADPNTSAEERRLLVGLIEERRSAIRRR